jgi:hypothetical protein
MWNSTSKEDKEIYFENARKQAAEHRIKYPGKIISFGIQYSLILLEIAK